MNGQKKTKSKDFIVIVVDGIIGAGKTTLIEDCLKPILSEDGYRVTVVNEPVEKWKADGSLKQFYEDPKRRAFQFQTKVFHDRVKKCQKKFEKYSKCTDIFLLERSIFTDLLFMEMLYDDGKVDQSEYDVYLELWTMWKKVMPFEPDLFIYLKPTIDTVMQRLNERNRTEEAGVDEDYQNKLQIKHDNFLGRKFVKISKSQYVPCVKLNTNSNFRDYEKIKIEITEQVKTEIEFLNKK